MDKVCSSAIPQVVDEFCLLHFPLVQVKEFLQQAITNLVIFIRNIVALQCRSKGFSPLNLGRLVFVVTSKCLALHTPYVALLLSEWNLLPL